MADNKESTTSAAENESKDDVPGTGPSQQEEGQPQPPAPTGAAGESGRAEGNGDAQESTDPAEVQQQPAEEEGGTFFVVGIGASAGGLEALGELIKYVPLDCMAFIVVQHLAPHHESILAQLLGRNARLEVVTAVDGMPLEVNHVYVIPPNADLALLHGVIRVISPPAAHGLHLPVDYLFRSLAEDQGHRAIGVVLSGTGTDGTFGLKAIKAAGGLTFVQDPSSAKYDGMPQSALSSGAADFCLAPKEIGDELALIAKRPHVRPAVHAPEPAPQVQDQLGKLFVLIRSEFGNDLTQYKQSTVDRRIERRMALHKIGRLDEYVRYVQSSREELRALYSDMLITVTSFFRDPDAFDALKSTVLWQILEQKEPNASIRVWVPACASGEEAYSIAMCLLELCEEKGRDVKVQIFGTDLDEGSIQHARRGIYAANIVLDVSPERINRFFVFKDNQYHVSRRVRDMVVFSQQNLLRDPPFSRMDLVSCRNLLIYLQPSAQKKVLRILHYALNPSGHLFLGSSETVGDAPDLFSLVDRKSKIYSKKHVAPQAGLDVTFGVPGPLEAPLPPPPVRATLSLQGLADRKVLELYGPAGVVINEDLDILQFRGHTGPYLDPAPGAASFNVLRLARFELHIELKSALARAISERRRVTTEVAYTEDGKQVIVMLDVVPLQDLETKTRCVLVLFHRLPRPKEVPVPSPIEGAPQAADHPLALRIHELERELAVTKEYLQRSNEDKESTLEELKSANEELQSSNEELQSTNEELETSKEEMQSTNEELTTVNEELHNRMAELSQSNDDLHNVLAGVDNAVVIIGMDLRIRRYTSAAEKLFNLVPGDVGRTIGFLDPFLGSGAIEPKVSAVIQSLSALEEELLACNHRWYVLKISPYKTLDHSIRGALVTLIDIDVRKRAAEMTSDVAAYAGRFLSPIGHPLLIVDGKLRVVWCNDSFLASFQVTREETLGSLLASIGDRHLADPGLRERVERVFTSASVFRDYAIRLRWPNKGEHRVRMGGSLIPASTDVPLALLSIEPVVEARPPEAP